MECDEELLRYLGQQAELTRGRWFYKMDPEGARALFAEISSAHGDDVSLKRPVGAVSDVSVDFGGEPLRMKIYRPQGAGRFPVVVYFHGGGFVFGTLEAYDNTVRMICAETDAVVVNVDYRLAPEHRFPVPVESCVAGIEWVKGHIDAFDGDPDAVVTMGDSAGGNLAAAAALVCAQRGIGLTGQVVHYGPMVHVDHVVAAGTRDWPSRDQRFGPVFESMSWYWNHYCAESKDGLDPIASPALATDLKGAPPALIAAGALDTLDEECVAYGRRLRDSGVPTRVTEYPRLTHGYIQHGWLPEGTRSTRAYQATVQSCADVKKLLRGEPPDTE
jgi:acetyl esterase